MPVIPTWLLKLLPYAAVVLLVLAGVAWIDHRGYERATRDAEMRQQADAILLGRQLAKLQGSLVESVGQVGRDVTIKLDGIETVNRTIIQPTIMKEIASDPRYSDPDAGISAGMLDALNAARRLSDPTAAGRGNSITLPVPPADQR